MYQVTEKENWNLGGKIIHRYKLDGYMIELKDASASLTANGGTIELKSGAILENNKAAQFGSGILANNGVKITMEKELERLRNLRRD